MTSNLQSSVQDHLPETSQTSVSSSVSNVQDPDKTITTNEKPKEKDPKRVAAGKRLAAISKAAKEKKMREALENESSSWKQCTMISLGIGFLSYFVYRRYFSSKEKKSVSFEEDEDLKPVHKTMTSTKKLPSRGKPISMFD